MSKEVRPYHTDYHNELYGVLNEKFVNENIEEKGRDGISKFDTEVLEKRYKNKKEKPWRANKNAATLPTFVRNAIHHPEGENKYTQAELDASINILRDILIKLE